MTLLEAQDTPGGKMRAVARSTGPVDAGPTVLTLHAVFDAVFEAAGEWLDDHLTFVSQPLLVRHWRLDGSRLGLFSNPKESATAIATFAGQRPEAEFIRFNRLSSQVYQAFDGPMRRAGRPDLPKIILNTLRSPSVWPALTRRSLANQLEHSFSDPRLRQLFGRYATYVGGIPDHSPAVLALIWQAEAQGVWAVQGGMHQLVQALAGLAERLGVTLRFGVSTVKIARRSGRAMEAVLSDSRSLKCYAVVFNGDPAALLAGRLGNVPQQALKPAHAHPRSLSAWVWAFAATPSPSGPPPQHLFRQRSRTGVRPHCQGPDA